MEREELEGEGMATVRIDWCIYYTKSKSFLLPVGFITTHKF